MLRPSGPGAPRFCATSPNARIRFPSLTTSSIVIAGRVSPGVFLDFGTAYRTEGAGRPVSVPGTAPRGLSAVSRKQILLACAFAGRGRLPSPHRARGWDRLSTAFRYYATIRLLSSHRHLVVGCSMTTATSAEAERSPRVRTQNFVPTPSPIRPSARRIWASLPLASSPAGSDASAALRFRSVRYCIVRLLPDTPSRDLQSNRCPCLVDGGFPPSGPQEDLTAYMSHLVVLCSCRAHPGLRALRAAPAAPLDPAAAI